MSIHEKESLYAKDCGDDRSVDIDRDMFTEERTRQDGECERFSCQTVMDQPQHLLQSAVTLPEAKVSQKSVVIIVYMLVFEFRLMAKGQQVQNRRSAYNY